MFFPYKDDNPRVLIPYVTYSLITINIVIFFYQFGMEFSDPEAAGMIIYAFGLIPADLILLSLSSPMIFCATFHTHFGFGQWK